MLVSKIETNYKLHEFNLDCAPTCAKRQSNVQMMLMTCMQAQGHTFIGSLTDRADIVTSTINKPTVGIDIALATITSDWTISAMVN